MRYLEMCHCQPINLNLNCLKRTEIKKSNTFLWRTSANNVRKNVLCNIFLNLIEHMVWLP